MVHHGHADRRRCGEGPPEPRGLPPDPIQHLWGPLGAQITHQVAGVDLHRAGRLAHAVHRAGLHHRVGFIGEQLGGQRLIAGRFRGSHGTLNDDALARRGGQVLAGADRFAVAAFDAVVDHGAYRCGLFDVLEVQPGILGQHRSRIEHQLRVTGPLDLPHRRIEFVAILPVDEGSHDASRPMLGLQRARPAEHQTHHVLGELLIALH